MDKDLLKYLFQRCMDLSASEEERDLFLAMAVMPENQSLMDELLGEAFGKETISGRPDADTNARVLSSILNVNRGGVIQSNVRSAKFAFMKKWVSIAAALILLGFVTYHFIVQEKSVNQGAPKSAEVIAPGKTGAMLTLSDGSVVLLDTIKEMALSLQGGGVAKISNGVVVYDGAGSEISYNTMSTPKGRQFRLLLPDGTAVWLNSQSSLRYPTVFTGGERRVELRGEAYFEIAKNSRQPFHVNVNDRVEVEVLGTEFNVKAYENEDNIQTTLLEGAVNVRVREHETVNSGSAKRLGVGEQAQIANALFARSVTVDAMPQDAVKVVREVDLAQVVAWKSGFFNFQGAGLQEVMRQLERWYDVEVVYEGNITRTYRFAGELEQNLPFGQMLRILERLDVKFRLEGRKLIVMK